MADQSDVENALVTLASAALYPDGTAAPSVPGPDCRIYRGWPTSAALDSDLSAGKINVTVFPGAGPGMATTRYGQAWVATPTVPSLAAIINGVSVTFSGTASAGQLAGILINGTSYVYRIQTGDTPTLVAAALAAQIMGQMIVQISGSTITIPGVGDLVVRVVADATGQQEIRRQRQHFRITSWCPSPVLRDTTAIAIDQALAQLRFIPLADGSDGRITYFGTSVFDQSEDALLYRRDLLYSIEYATLINAAQPSMLFGIIDLNDASLTA